MSFKDDSTPIRFTPGRDNKYNNADSTESTRPTGDPKSTKNFQKILGKDSDKDQDADEAKDSLTVDDEEGAQSAMILVEEKALKKKQAPASLFELSSRAAKGSTLTPDARRSQFDNHVEKQYVASSTDKPSEPEVQNVEATPTESPADIFAKIKAKEPKHFEDHVDHVQVPSEPKTEVQDKFTSRFATEQPDLSYVNPMALNTQTAQQTNFNIDKPVAPHLNIQEIIDQLVDKVVQMETGGRTDTVITLKQPPILAGADLIVTGFDSAKGEFNITFQKLTQAAKNMLDMRVNQESLLHALEQKGYAVHIVNNTTETIINVPTAGASNPQDRNRNPDQQKEQKQQQQQQK